jgi:DNA-directed RNA polymerase specialized sigma24 family protein
VTGLAQSPGPRFKELDGATPDPKPDTQAIAWGRMDLDTALTALRTLLEPDRAALLMHAQDGLSHAAIAACLNSVLWRPKWA